MPIATVGDLVDATSSGREHFCSFRKVPSQATTAGWWADLSMAAGNPVPNYYAAAPLAAKTLDGFDGLFHGADKTPGSKYVTGVGIVTPTAAALGRYTLCDYVAFYPFVDGDSTDAQSMDNTTPLPRYTDGAGLQVMAVAVAPSTGAGSFTFTYVNQDGVTRTSPVQSCSTTGANIATIVTSQQAVAGAPGGPFLKLASGDTGVRSIVDVTFAVANGGLISLVLVKPLLGVAVREVNTMAEVQLIRQRPILPQVVDGAYLGWIVNVAGSIAAATIVGYLSFAWSA